MRYLTRIFAALLITYLSLNVTDLIGQTSCVSTQDIEIIGGERRTLTFNVSGVVNDDLSLATQGIQSIKLEFEHTKVGDLEIFLTSPSGQVIQIIGPRIPGSRETDLVLGWDLTFLPCSETPAPDFPNVLEYANDLPWLGLADYNGSYLPYQGCFEEINTGSVNGIWTLDIVDGDLFDSGMINNIEIKFIDQEGLAFEICEADAGSFLTPLMMTVCDFQTELQDDLILDFQTDYKREDDNFRYEFIIADFLTGDVIDVIEEPSLRGVFPEGNRRALDYSICPISYNVLDSAEIFDQITGSNLTDIRRFINQTPSPVCASVVMNCLTIEVIPILDTLRLDTTICKNGEFELRDGTGVIQTFTEPRDLVRKIGAEVCDSLIILSITQSEIEAVISTDTDTILNCPTDTIILGSSRSITNSAPTRIWTTGGGEIIGDPTRAQIRVAKPGMYNLEIFNEGCSDNITIEIGEDFDVPDIRLSVFDTITCENPQTMLTLITEEILFNVLWKGPDFSSSNFSNVVTRGGIYTFSADNINGCTYLDTIEVIENFSVPDFDVNTVSVGCKAQIMFEDSTLIPIGAKWLSPDGEELIGLTPIVTDSGTYNLVVSSETVSGCIDTIPKDIFFTPPVSDLILTGDQLSCKDSIANISINSSQEFDIILWDGPGVINQGDSIQVSTQGIYTVVTRDEDNCPGIGEFEVIKDTIPVSVAIDGRNFGCTEEELILSVTSSQDAAEAMWTGPNDSGIGSQFPIRNIGLYIVSIEDENGCIGMDTFNVGREEPFDVVIQENIFDCDLEPIDLMSTISLAQADINWLGPNGFTSTDRTIEIVDTGLYILSVTSADQCVVVDSSFVDIKKPDFSITDLDDLTINCSEQSVQLNPQVIGDFSSAVWVSESMDIFPQLDPVVSQGGRYQLEVEDEFACRLDTFLLVNVDTLLPAVNIDQMGALACESEEVVLTAEIDFAPNPIILWLGDDGPLQEQENPIQEITEAGTYTLRVFNPINSCFSQDEVIITQEENSLIDIELRTKSSCEGLNNGSVLISDVIGGERPYETSLDSMNFQMIEVYDGLGADDYKVYVKDSNGCVLGKDFSIDEDAILEIDLGDDIEEFAGELIEITIDTTGLNVSTIDWFSDDDIVSTNTDTLRFTGTDDTNIRVQLMTANGCVALDDLDVMIQARESQIYEPNSFLVGEGVNSIFRIQTNRSVQRINQFYIYDRWGNEMYGIDNVLPQDDFGWDGRLNGDFAEQGVYAYFSKITLDSGEIEILKGTLTLFWR